nr:hypothetical protein GCM10020092_060150 [Actinoplanes digitatis]
MPGAQHPEQHAEGHRDGGGDEHGGEGLHGVLPQAEAGHPGRGERGDHPGPQAAGEAAEDEHHQDEQPPRRGHEQVFEWVEQARADPVLERLGDVVPVELDPAGDLVDRAGEGEPPALGELRPQADQRQQAGA